MISKKSVWLLSVFVLSIQFTNAQKQFINVIDSGRKTSLRGLSVVENNVVWASGSNGTVARSVDGGKTFEWLTVAGYEKRDFRDIEAFDANTAIIMGIAEPAIILKTKDAGKSWYKVFEDTTKGMFLDAMDFADKKHGIIVGDPINDTLFIRLTNDCGETWNKKYSTSISAFDGEAFFAASGTNVVMTDSNNFIMVTGGNISRVLFPQENVGNVFSKGEATSGANSVAFFPKRKIVITGGDFQKDTSMTNNCILNPDFPYSWDVPKTPPHGYRSCVEYITKDKLITCGTSGVDISNDGGMNWELISTQSFHVCQKAKKGNKVFLAGSNGKIAILNTP